jgi:hypothetical protein
MSDKHAELSGSAQGSAAAREQEGEPGAAGDAEQHGEPGAAGDHGAASERVGPVAIARHVKADGRALILYTVDRQPRT